MSGIHGRRAHRSPLDRACGVVCARSSDRAPISERQLPAGSATPRSLNHVLIDGTRTLVGIGGTPPLTTAQPYENLMLDALCAAAATRGASCPSSRVTWCPARASPSKRCRARSRIGHQLPVRMPGVSVHGGGGMAYAGLNERNARLQNLLDQVQRHGHARAPGMTKLVSAVHAPCTARRTTSPATRATSRTSSIGSATTRAMCVSSPTSPRGCPCSSRSSRASPCTGHWPA